MSTQVMAPIDLDDGSDEAILAQEGIVLFGEDGTLVPAIQDDETYKLVAARLIEKRGWVARVEAFFKPMADAAHKAHKAITERRALLVDGPKKLCEVDAKLLGDYDAKKRREAEILAARAAQEAYEAARIAREEGRPSVPVVVPTVPAPTTPKVDGLGFSDKWYAEVTDLKALCRAVADGVIPEISMAGCPPEWKTVLDRMATSLKSMMAVPGVEAKSKRVPRRT